jgi:hypothetical protein
MSLLARRKSKPNLGVGIDPTHPLARGLALCLPINEGSGSINDLVNGQSFPLAAGGSWTSGTPYGAGLAGSGSTAGITPLTTLRSAISAPYSATVIYSPTSSTGLGRRL